MKVTIAYTADEQEAAANTAAVLRQMYPGIRMRESDRQPPFKHLYLTTKKPGKRCKSNKLT